jgi:hypothetical protein
MDYLRFDAVVGVTSMWYRSPDYHRVARLAGDNGPSRAVGHEMEIVKENGPEYISHSTLLSFKDIPPHHAGNGSFP